jgi:type III secretion system (T3SS) SseB-like protein
VRFLDRVRHRSDALPRNARLLSAIDDVAKSDTADSRRRLYEAFLSSTLLVATDSEVGPSGTRVLGQEQTFNLLSGENSSGDSMLYAFTDDDAAAAMLAPGTALLGFAAAEVFRVAVENRSGILVNAAGPVRGELTHEEVATLASGNLPGIRRTDEVVTLSPGSRVTVGLPRTPPPAELVRQIKAVLAGDATIKAAFLYQLYTPGATPHPVVAAMADEPLAERRGPLFAQLAEIWRPYLGADEFVDFQEVSPNDELVQDRTTLMTIFER